MVSHRFQKSILTWRTPPNWSWRDRSEELKAEIGTATWEAGCDFDPVRGVPLDAFVQRRIWARCVSRYRREWADVRRCGIHLERRDDCEVSIHKGFSSIPISESLQTCLRRLPEQRRCLIECLFWEDKTEVEVARMLCFVQSGISRCKRRILDRFRHWMEQSEKEKPTGRKIEGIKRSPPCILIIGGRGLRAVGYRSLVSNPTFHRANLAVPKISLC
jgi:DNA-directed RNA polymerase specialized sigma24 family protein